MRRAIAFLTSFGGAAAPDPSAVAWFPVVGAVLGLALGGIWWLAARLWAAPVAAAVVVAADLALTGMLHFDGLVDAADGLLAHLDRSRRLEVMAEPGVGAFGLGAGGIALLVRWAALASLAPSAVLLVGVWAGARASMVVVMGLVPYARAEHGGLASRFVPERRRGTLVVGVLGLAGSLAVVMLYRTLPGAVAWLCAGSVGLAVVAFAVRRLGGYTGDVLGALGVAFETTALAVAAARW
jgi:adenosylcobinamide-GDP ribazoletransferase